MCIRDSDRVVDILEACGALDLSSSLSRDVNFIIELSVHSFIYLHSFLYFFLLYSTLLGGIFSCQSCLYFILISLDVFYFFSVPLSLYIPDPLKKYNLIFLLIQFIANFTPDYVLII